MSQIFSFSRCLIATSLVLTLFGCGGDESESNTPPPIEVFPIAAIDGFSTAKPEKTTHIDLTPYIRGGDAKLVSVQGRAAYSAMETCAEPVLNGVGFDVVASTGTLCDYQFTVKDAQTSASARMTILATVAESPMLPPLSRAMTLSDGEITLDLVAMLGSSVYPDGYSIKSVSVQGGDDNLGTVADVTPNSETILYTPPMFSGWNRLVYTLSNKTKPGADIMGTVYVTISESANRPPTIPNREYNYNAEQNKVVNAGESINIDLSTIGITEPDNQDWQLIAAQSIGATVGAGDPSSVLNKIITFQAPNAGRYDISYIVGDHYGGYSFGIIRVTVSGFEQAANWESLTVGRDKYSAPLRYSDGVKTGFGVTSQWDNTVSNTIAGYNQTVGHAYCNTVGIVPSVTQMTALKTAYYAADGTGELNKWPASKTYLAKKDNAYVGYNIIDGTTVAYNAATPYYVTCIANQSIILTQHTNEVVANGARVKIATIALPVNTAVQIDDLTPLDVGRAVTSVGRELYIYTESTKAGQYQFKVTNTADVNDAISSNIINYIADVNTARLDSVEVDKTTVFANGIDKATFLATVLDANRNPVSNTSVRLTHSEAIDNSTASVEYPSGGLTDLNGEFHATLTDTEVEKVDVALLVGTTFSDNVTIEFAAPRKVVGLELRPKNTLLYVGDPATKFTAYYTYDDGSIKDVAAGEMIWTAYPTTNIRFDGSGYVAAVLADEYMRFTKLQVRPRETPPDVAPGVDSLVGSSDIIPSGLENGRVTDAGLTAPTGNAFQYTKYAGRDQWWTKLLWRVIREDGTAQTTPNRHWIPAGEQSFPGGYCTDMSKSDGGGQSSEGFAVFWHGPLVAGGECTYRGTWGGFNSEIRLTFPGHH